MTMLTGPRQVNATIPLVLNAAPVQHFSYGTYLVHPIVTIPMAAVPETV